MQSREAACCPVPPTHGLNAVYGSMELERRKTTALLFDKLVEVLNVLFGELEVYVDINKGVRARSGSVKDISESLRVSALNGVLAVDKLGARAAGLRPVLDRLRVLSGEITQEVVRLAESLEELVDHVDRVVFGLSAAKLQIEMTAQFAHELVDHAALTCASKVTIESNTDLMTEGAIGILHASACEAVGGALGNLAVTREKLSRLNESQNKLLDANHFLRPIYLTGKIEMADGAGARLAMVFKDVGDLLEQTGANLNELKNLLGDLETHLARGVAHRDRVERITVQIDSQIDAGAAVSV
jgi:hypothetical protein